MFEIVDKFLPFVIMLIFVGLGIVAMLNSIKEERERHKLSLAYMLHIMSMRSQSLSQNHSQYHPQKPYEQYQPQPFIPQLLEPVGAFNKKLMKVTALNVIITVLTVVTTLVVYKMFFNK